MLNEQQLITASNETYLPNTSGLITAQRVRDFNNTDLIPTIFDISASLQNTINGITTGTGFVTTQSFNAYTSSQTAESASVDSRLDALEASDTSVNTFTQSINTFTQSINQFTQSYNTGSFTGSFSGDGSKLFGVTASIGGGIGILDEGIYQGNAITLNFTGSNISASVIGGIGTINVTPTDVSMFLSKSTFEAYTASLDNTFATDAQLSASASTLQNNINTLSSSVAVTDLAQSQSIAALQSWSSSLDTVYATDAQLSASASTLQNNINTKLDSASFNSYTASQSSNITASLGSYLLTSSFNTYTQSAASGVSASINAATSSLSQSLSASIGSLSASNAAVNAGQLSTASFNSYTQSNDSKVNSLISATGSYATTGSNTFKANQIVSGNIDVTGTITALSASITYLQTIFETASVIYSSGSNQLGDELSDVQTLSGSVRVQGGLTVNGIPVQTSSFDASGYLLTSSFNTYTQSAAANTSASINTATASLSQSLSSSIGELSASVAAINATQLSTASFNTYTASAATNVSGAINTATQSLSSSIATTTSNLSSSIGSLSASIAATDAGQLSTASFNSYTASQTTISASFDSRILNISGTYATTASNTFTGLQTLNGGLDVNSTATLDGAVTASKGITVQDILINTGSAGSRNVAIGITSLQQSAGGNDNVAIGYGAMRDASNGSDNVVIGRSAGANRSDTSVPFVGWSENVLIGKDAGFEAASSYNTIVGGDAGKQGFGLAGVGANTLIGHSAGFNLITGVKNTMLGRAAGLAVGGAAAASASNHIILSDGDGNIGLVVDSNEKVIIDSLFATGSITASNFVGTASYAIQALTASFALNGGGGSVPAGTVSSSAQIAAFGYATTGSNTFIGNQTITGSTFVSGNITLAQGFDLVTHHVQAAGANGVEIQNNSGNTAILVGAGGSLGTTFNGQINTTAISSSGNITGNLIGTASYATQALTASFALNATTVSTASLLTTASATGNVITFTKGDGSTFPVTVATGSGGGTIDTGSFATTGSNTFKGTQTINLTASAETTAIGILGNADKVLVDMYVEGGNYDTFNVLVSASNGIQFRDYNFTLNAIQPFISVDTDGGNMHFDRRIAAPGNNPAGTALEIVTGSVAITGQQGTGYFYSNLPITSSGLRINGTALVADLIVSGVFGGNSSLQVLGNASISGTLTLSSSAAIELSVIGGQSNSGSIAITGSAPTQLLTSGGLTLSGSLLSNVTDIYTGSNNANFIVTLGSASMATLIAGGTTNPNTLYFVI